MHTFTLSRGKQKQMDLWNLRRQKKDLRNWGGGNARNGTQGLSHARQALSHSATFQLLFFYNLFREGSQYAVQAALELMLQVGEALNFSSSLRDPLGSIIDLSHQACLLFFFPKGEKKQKRRKCHTNKQWQERHPIQSPLYRLFNNNSVASCANTTNRQVFWSFLVHFIT